MVVIVMVTVMTMITIRMISIIKMIRSITGGNRIINIQTSRFVEYFEQTQTRYYV